MIRKTGSNKKGLGYCRNQDPASRFDMIIDFYDTPNLVSVQYMDREIAKRLDKMIGTWFRRNSELVKEHDRALHLARCELEQYEEWLVQQDRVDPASYLFDEDVPY